MGNTINLNHRRYIISLRQYTTPIPKPTPLSKPINPPTSQLFGPHSLTKTISRIKYSSNTHISLLFLPSSSFPALLDPSPSQNLKTRNSTPSHQDTQLFTPRNHVHLPCSKTTIHDGHFVLFVYIEALVGYFHRKKPNQIENPQLPQRRSCITGQTHSSSPFISSRSTPSPPRIRVAFAL